MNAKRKSSAVEIIHIAGFASKLFQLHIGGIGYCNICVHIRLYILASGVSRANSRVD